MRRNIGIEDSPRYCLGDIKAGSSTGLNFGFAPERTCTIDGSPFRGIVNRRRHRCCLKFFNALIQSVRDAVVEADHCCVLIRRYRSHLQVSVHALDRWVAEQGEEIAQLDLWDDCRGSFK